LTTFKRSIVAASYTAPVITNSFARPLPARSASRCVPPIAGVSPTVGPRLRTSLPRRSVCDFLEGGLELAYDRVGKRGRDLFATEDLQNALHSFLTTGPGSASFEGR
jgi:hypothetical protein